jgi:hypothetical protein
MNNLHLYLSFERYIGIYATNVTYFFLPNVNKHKNPTPKVYHKDLMKF